MQSLFELFQLKTSLAVLVGHVSLVDSRMIRLYRQHAKLTVMEGAVLGDNYFGKHEQRWTGLEDGSDKHFLSQLFSLGLSKFALSLTKIMFSFLTT